MVDLRVQESGSSRTEVTLNPQDPFIRKMVDAAREAASRAYAPYSEFKVGAAVLSEGGQMFTGCNVENASYSLTMCAERNAIFQAVAAGCRRIVSVVVFTDTDEPAPSCGACRQVTSELAPDAQVFSFSGNGACIESTVSSLLPYPCRLGT